MRIGIDIGTATTRIAVEGRGIVLREPSVIADCGPLPLGWAVGAPARRVLGRTPSHVQAIQPVRRGVVSAPVATRDMMRRLLKKATGWNVTRPTAHVAAPSKATVLERQALTEACRAAGAGKVSLVPVTVAAAHGADPEVGLRHPVTVMDIGAGLTEAALISDDVLLQEAISVGSEDFDRAIAAHLRAEHNLEIGMDAAEELKLAIGSADPGEDERRARVWGREMSSGLPLEVEVTAGGLRRALSPCLSRITALGQALLDVSPPFLAGDILERGMILTGGGSLLRGLPQLLAERLGIPVRLADDPCGCVALGALSAVEHGWSEV